MEAGREAAHAAAGKGESSLHFEEGVLITLICFLHYRIRDLKILIYLFLSDLFGGVLLKIIKKPPLKFLLVFF